MQHIPGTQVLHDYKIFTSFCLLDLVVFLSFIFVWLFVFEVSENSDRSMFCFV